MKVLGLAAAILFAALSAASAGEALTGRWAADPAWCWRVGGPAGQSPLVVTGSAVRWQDDSCRIARMYKTGDTVHIQAQCWRGGSERTVPVSLRPQGGRIQLRWDRVAAGNLRRCR